MCACVCMDTGMGMGNEVVAVERVYPDTKVPCVAFVVFQGMFAAITPALAFGAAAERIRIVPCLVFLFLWSTFVYGTIHSTT